MCQVNMTKLMPVFDFLILLSFSVKIVHKSNIKAVPLNGTAFSKLSAFGFSVILHSLNV